MVLISRCLSCGRKVDQPPGKGRPRLYCSRACKARAYRRRRIARFSPWAADAPTFAPAACVSDAELDEALTAAASLPQDPDEAVVAAVFAAWTAVRMLARCGEIARNTLAWHCTTVADHLAADLRKHFEAKEADDERTCPDRCRCCAAPIEQPPGRGQRRSFCSDRCRSRAHRAAVARRQALRGVLVGGRDLQARNLEALAALSDDELGLPADPDEAVLVALAQTEVTVAVLERVATIGRPEMAWRCQDLADALRARMARCFDERCQYRVLPMAPPAGSPQAQKRPSA